MSRVRSLDFLPEVFQTETNKQFLSATLDQLVQEPKLKQTSGFIGKKSGPGVTGSDAYIAESNSTRANYQLDPGVVFLKQNQNAVEDMVSYPGLIESLGSKGAFTNKADRLFDSQYYSWDPMMDFDKFVNFGQYYWLVNGPDLVDVYATTVNLVDDFAVTRSGTGYTFSDVPGRLPTITLARNGNYTFEVNQSGNPFYIQTNIGTAGELEFNGRSSREILGVTNNGAEVGTITFNVPSVSAQDFYYGLTDGDNVDLVTTLDFDQINGKTFDSLIAEHGGIDGIRDLENRSLIFYDQTPVESGSQAYSVWTINYTGDTVNPTLSLTVLKDIADLTRLEVNYGTQFGGLDVYKTAQGFYELIPLITANLDTLYYQDGNNADFYGIIRIIDDPDSPSLNVNDILADDDYTSPNGVTFTNGLRIRFTGTTVPASYSGNQYYIEGVGTQIQLLPVTDFITPEDYTNIDSVDDLPDTPDYLTINRASPDKNPWSRSNRWFHIDVINAAAGYNNTAPVVDFDLRAKRSIIEFRSGLKLFDFGTSGLPSVNTIDFSETDALSNINGTIGYSNDGYDFEQGSRVIFANDIDDEVRNKIFTVNFAQFEPSGPFLIDLQPTDLGQPDTDTDATVVISDGETLKGNSYWFDGLNWQFAQQKTGVNQAPLFDVFDSKGNSYGDTTYFPSTDFEGSKIFSYKVGTGTADPYLGFPLTYRSINNVGDIVFENNFYTDTFNYVNDNVGVVQNVDEGFVRFYTDLTTFTRSIGYQTAFNQIQTRQVLEFTYQGSPLVLDVELSSNLSEIPIKVYVNGVFVLPNTYSYATNAAGFTVITFDTEPDNGAIVEVTFLSESISGRGFYEVPDNLEKNPLNGEIQEVTMGTIRTHYGSICENLQYFTGVINGQNNTRDLGNIVPYGQTIVQQSSPLVFASTFLYNNKENFIQALDYARDEYTKYKNLIMDKVAKSDWGNKKASTILDEVLQDINSGKNKDTAFYYTDTLPHGVTYDETTYTVSVITGNTFDMLNTYDFTKANYKGVLVYLNDEILLGDGHQYTVATDGPRITVTETLNVGDVLKIREFASTVGSYIPSTPAKMGMASLYLPEKYTDSSYITPTPVIRGHDGSITVAYDDIRDDVLLEFESRIYNNVKVVNRYAPPIGSADIIPGRFRTTDYSLAEINDFLSAEFYTYVAKNRLTYRTQSYDASNQFTWNYSRSQDKTSGDLLLGGWRGIYNYFYDTDTPNLTPWVMLGLAERPDWWVARYGPAPYTSGNLVLWQDLRDGKIVTPTGTTIDQRYVRPDLLDIIPNDSEGNLVSPFISIVGGYDQNSFRKSWVFGDDGPVENAWRRSSDYQFTIQKLLALLNPGKYFSLMVDIDLYTYNSEFSQYLYNQRFRVQPQNIQVYGNGTIKHSYINYIVDYNKVRGIDSTTQLETTLDNLDVRLVYRMGGFSDKTYLKIFTEKSSPNSLNSSLLLPDESYQLILYKNAISAEFNYSGVVVQNTATGYTVNGYSTQQPYFIVKQSRTTGTYSTITVGSETVNVAQDFNEVYVKIPYGYEFTSKTGVVDFLVSYQEYLTDQGMIFDHIENNYIMNWTQMATEFLTWSQEGWAVNSIINLNPAADVLKLTRSGYIVDSLISNYYNESILNPNRQVLPPKDYVVERYENDLVLRTFNNNTVNYVKFRFTQYEHAMVIDNTSVFNDLIYDPVLGVRQTRLLLNGYKTYEWNGSLDAQGFILNEDNIIEWQVNKAYTKGQIVKYKGDYWSARRLLAPAETFVFADWIKSDYDKITKGLVPNAATKAELSRNYYDINTANLESDADLLGFGLIGFRPRQYMQNLNLDDISQVNLYSQFLGSKGTIQAVEVFSNADLQKEAADYEVYENWAILRSLYGASANRSFVELRLDEDLLDSNPSTVEVTLPGETTTANQHILLENVYKQSYKLPNTSILPVLSDDTPTDASLPTAGYVNYDDVDIKVFDINDLTTVINNLDDIFSGTNIWVAKANTYSWNVYRTVAVNSDLVQLRDNLDGTSTLTFNGQHNLSAGQIIVVKYFDASVDGAYEITSVPTLRSVNIEFSLTGEVTTVTGEGVALVLESVRVAQGSDIADLSFANSFDTGSLVWVDDNGSGKWTTLEKTNPFTINTALQPARSATTVDDLFGTAVSQGLNGQGALIGAPGYESDIGGVYCYNKDENNNYTNTVILVPVNKVQTNVGFGSAIASGGTEWSAVGAPSSLSARGYATTVYRNPLNGAYELRQIFVETTTTTDSRFGGAVAISADERWMYVGAPGDDEVYAYNKVSVQNQNVSFTGDGQTLRFFLDGYIVVDDDSSSGGIGSQQINVTVGGFVKVANVDWTFVDNSIEFITAPKLGEEVKVSRISKVSYFPQVTTTVFNTENLYTATDYYSFNVIVNGELMRPILDYTFNAGTKEITLATGVVDVAVTISADTYWKLVDSFTYSGTTGDSSTLPQFGYSLSTTTDGRQVIVGSPDDDPSTTDFAGSVQIIDRSVERFQVTNVDTKAYTVLRAPNGPVTVTLNGEFLTPTSPGNIGAQFSVSGSIITLASTVTLGLGDIIEIETNTFKLMQNITSASIQRRGNFGYAVKQCGTNCSVYVGQPNDSRLVPEGGSVDRWANQARLYGIISSTTANPALTIGHSVRINNYDVVLTGTTASSFVTDVTNADIPNVQASISNGIVTLSLVNVSAGEEFIKLQVLPGLGTAYDDLGFKPMYLAQTINPPINIDHAHFGQSIDVDVTVDTLVVGAPDGSANEHTTFDSNTTIFDGNTLEFRDIDSRTGVVYTYDFLTSSSPSTTNPGKYVFGREIFDNALDGFDRFGNSVSYYDGVLLVGSPYDDLGDSVGDYGRVGVFTNATKALSWQSRYTEPSIVDVSMLNAIFLYDRTNGRITSNLDYIDPLQGKILGSAKQNIDYIVGLDPARYNVGSNNNNGTFWADEMVGEIWWDISTCRFIDYRQDSIEYKARRWGQLFPGSTVDVYQWIESTVPPSQYTGTGSVYSNTSYTITSELNNEGLFESKYYFWVKGIRTIPSTRAKTLSTVAIEQYIENPRSSGIPYFAGLSPSTYAIYNTTSLVVATDTILHIEFDRIKNDDNVHSEYDLIAVGNPDSFLGDGLYRKMLDSFSGEDTVGNIVPDPFLNDADKQGVSFRPRQSFFVNRFDALQNYISKTNAILLLYPIAETRILTYWKSQEEEPTSASGQWDKRVATYSELTYQNLFIVPIGYRYLVASDETNDGLWTIYTLQADRTLLLTRVQNYDTNQYWEYADWILQGYDTSVAPVQEVATYNDLLRLTVNNGDSVKVTANSAGKYEIYQYLSSEWVRVVAEDATVQVKAVLYNYALGRFGFDLEVFDVQRFDQNPKIETRQIIKGINEDIFTKELLIYRNQLLDLTFEYIFSEQTNIEWLTKTSLIDVNHNLRELIPYQIYRQDNQDFVQDYIEEVKPYHVKIKEFNLKYDGLDTFQGTLTDFDVPAFYDSNEEKFISPILGSGTGEYPSTDPIWTSLPWSQWYSNYLLSLNSVTIANGGSGYTVAPSVTVTGTATRLPTLRATINASGQVNAIIIDDYGTGYSTTPIITLTGGNGNGAQVVPIMENLQVRSFDTTMKFDRIEYSSTVVDWTADTTYTEGSLVRYLGKVYSVNEVLDSTAINSGDSFDPDQYTVVDASTLSGANRTIGLYDPDPQDPGRELAQLWAGVDYPGVQVTGPLFSENTGFDVGAFDINPFDNIEFGPEGLPTYSTSILDTIYLSSFTDTYLGQRSTDINVEGGGFVDTYSSHAPEELIPGRMYDTLDLRVYTRPGGDATGDGHGFDMKSTQGIFGATNVTISFSDVMENPMFIQVENRDLDQVLNPIDHYTIDWANKTVTVSSGASTGDEIELLLFGVGGGNQLYKETWNGSSVGNSLTIPVAYTEIASMLIVVNGSIISSYTYAASGDYATEISFSNTYTSTDSLLVVAFGATTPAKSWSSPITEDFVFDGSTLAFTLSNSLQGTNPINLIVRRNGFRLRPAESVEYTGDGSSTGPYYLPTRGLINQGLIVDSDVKVYVDQVLQTLTTDYTITAWDGSSDRWVEFVTAPDSSSNIVVSVSTNADYTLSGSTLTLLDTPAGDSVISVTTFNDTSEQDLLTQVFVGPTTTGALVSEGYDQDGISFDEATTSFTSGSFDYATGVVLYTNDFDTGRTITASNRLFVSLNGRRLYPGADYTVDGSVVTIGGSILGGADVLVITSMTQSVANESLNFRIFQDMIGTQKLLRLYEGNTTKLSSALATDDETIYVVNASLLTEPNLSANIFGAIIINGERITYSSRNTVTNTLTGLRRGVAGTGVASHSVNASVSDVTVGQQLPAQYQISLEKDTFTGDGVTQLFLCPNLTLDTGLDSTEIEEAVQVKVGGTVLGNSEYFVADIGPVEVSLVTPPADGVDIEIYIEKSKVMYAQGGSAASNGLPLQDQTTVAARFLRGEI